MTSSKPQMTAQGNSNRAHPSVQSDSSFPNLSALTAAIRKNNVSLNQIELKAITAMVAYVAYVQKVSEETVCSVLSTAFSVDEVKALPSTLYDDAIRFLMNIRINEVLN